MNNVEYTCQRAEALLVDLYHTPLTIEVQQQFESTHVVLRCALCAADQDARIPHTVIIKQRTLPSAIESQGFDQAQLFANEWAALAFLATSAPGRSLGPHMYASNREQGIVVLEDLGAAPTVQEVLYGSDGEQAQAALVALGPCLGRLQAATYGLESSFRAQQRMLGATTAVSDATLDCRTRLADIYACMTALSIDIPARFDAALHAVEESIHEPGMFRAFVHNDAGVHNAQITSEGIRLLDFEFAGYGHGFLDVVCARLAFPPAFRGRCVSDALVQQLEQGYREQMIPHIPALSDDRWFAQALAQASAHWALSKLIGMWPYLRERLAIGEAYDMRGGRAPERSAFFRKQVFTYLRLAHTTLEKQNQLPEVRDGLARIIERVLHLWPDTPLLDQFPAFGGEPWRYP